ncbi:MAG: hypothetical protein DWQ08_05685, partial [Proteobacteria bacterium]
MFSTDGKFLGRGLARREPLQTTRTENAFAAYDIFCRVFAIRPDDKVLFLADKRLDPRVISAVIGLAKSRGVREPLVLMAHSTQISEMPEWAKPHLEAATFVISTWFCSVIDPFAIRMRREKGQRWVKITYFRDLDLLDTEQARFPPELLGEIIRGTARQYPRGDDF